MSLNDKKHLLLYYMRIITPFLPEPPEMEFKFLDDRKFRFDYAYPDIQVGIEVDGGAFAYGGGRHKGGSDYEKFLLAQIDGWAVYAVRTVDLESNPAYWLQLLTELLLSRGIMDDN